MEDAMDAGIVHEVVKRTPDGKRAKCSCGNWHFLDPRTSQLMLDAVPEFARAHIGTNVRRGEDGSFYLTPAYALGPEFGNY